MHPPSLDSQHHRCAMSASNAGRGLPIGRKMNMLASPGSQPFLPNGCEPAGRRAVIEVVGWLNGIQTEIYPYRMTLVGADAFPVGAESKTLFVALRDDFSDRKLGQVHTDSGCTFDQVRHLGPPVRVEHESNLVRAMTQNEAEKLARLNRAGFHRFRLASEIRVGPLELLVRSEDGRLEKTRPSW